MGYSKIVSGNKCVVTKYGELGPNHNEIVIFSGSVDEYNQWEKDGGIHKNGGIHNKSPYVGKEVYSIEDMKKAYQEGQISMGCGCYEINHCTSFEEWIKEKL